MLPTTLALCMALLVAAPTADGGTDDAVRNPRGATPPTGPERPAAPPEPGAPPRPDEFTALDLDNDGWISRGEAARWEDLSRRFDAADLDGSGRIGPAEFSAFEEARGVGERSENQEWIRQPGITERGYGVPPAGLP